MTDIAHKGLLKLMLRLPALRSQLQTLSGRNDAVQALCEAYEDASCVLERLRKSEGGAQTELLSEYQTLCMEIEAEVSAICISKHA